MHAHVGGRAALPRCSSVQLPLFGFCVFVFVSVFVVVIVVVFPGLD